MCKWFYANPLWYYHRPGTDEEIVANRRFYQLVDEELKELCHLLHSAGLRTTPSCQGHFYPRERFERIWEELQREQPRIRDGGLSVKDSETDETYLFHDERFQLPWSDFEGFYDEAGRHQSTGYLGIVVPPECQDLAAALDDLTQKTPEAELGFDPCPHPQLGGRLFHILAYPSEPSSRSGFWRKGTEVFGRLIQEHAPTLPGAAGAVGTDLSQNTRPM